MDFGIQGKTALVAAASKGLGFAAANELAAEGVNLAICSRDEDRINEAAEKIRSRSGREVLALVADVRKTADIDRLLEEVRQKFGDVDILVTNAGGPPAGMFDDLDDESWQNGFDLTMMSAVRFIRRVLPGMKAKSWGRIINILSISVKQPIPGLLISNAIRPGLVGLAKSLSDEVAAAGVTVNNVCPGWTGTERVGEILAARAQKSGQSPKQIEAEIVSGVPMGRMGRPAELAALIAFLSSERASYITGATIQVDGGAYHGLM